MKSKGAESLAFSALLGAASLGLLYGASVAPAGRWGAVALAGLGPCALVASVSLPAGFLCWGGVSLLAFLLLPDKLCALLFTVFFGLYPMIKSLAERLRRLAAWLLKLAFFNTACAVVFLLMGTALLQSVPAFLNGTAVLWLTANVIFFVYDLGLTRLICLYLARVDRAVRRFVRR